MTFKQLVTVTELPGSEVRVNLTALAAANAVKVLQHPGGLAADVVYWLQPMYSKEVLRRATPALASWFKVAVTVGDRCASVAKTIAKMRANKLKKTLSKKPRQVY